MGSFGDLGNANLLFVTYFLYLEDPEYCMKNTVVWHLTVNSTQGVKCVCIAMQTVIVSSLDTIIAPP